MKKSQLLVQVIGTVFCIALFSSGDHEYCAVGIALSVFVTLGWIGFILSLDKKPKQ